MRAYVCVCARARARARVRACVCACLLAQLPVVDEKMWLPSVVLRPAAPVERLQRKSVVR